MLPDSSNSAFSEGKESPPDPIGHLRLKEASKDSMFSKVFAVIQAIPPDLGAQSPTALQSLVKAKSDIYGRMTDATPGSNDRPANADFVVSKEAGKAQRKHVVDGLVDLTSKGKKPYHAAAQKERTKFMQEKGFFLNAKSGDLTLYAPHSNSGVIKGQPLNNIYLAMHHDGEKWRSIVGAAQGAELKVPKPDKGEPKMTKEEKKAAQAVILETYKQEAVYQAAFSMLGQYMAAKMNGVDYKPAPMIVLSNYLSDSSERLEGNAKMVKLRTAAVADFQANGIPLEALHAALLKIAPGINVHDVIPPRPDGGAAQPFAFNQAGMNLARFYSKRTDESKFFDHIEKNCKEGLTNDRVAAEILADLKSSSPPPLGFFEATIKTIGVATKLSKENIDTHREAMKVVLEERLGITVVGGCKSAKDREGFVRILAQTYQDYIKQKGAAPPGIGSAEYKQMNPSDQAILDKAFVKNYFSAAVQFVAHSNAENASGIKNNGWLLGAEQRNLINQECKTQIAKLDGDISRVKDSLDKLPVGQSDTVLLLKLAELEKSKNFYTQMTTDSSNKLAEGNNDYKKMDSPGLWSKITKALGFGEKAVPAERQAESSRSRPADALAADAMQAPKQVEMVKTAPGVTRRTGLDDGSYNLVCQVDVDSKKGVGLKGP